MDQRTMQEDSSSQQRWAKGQATANTRDTTRNDQQCKVAVLAYALYEQRGREDGHALDDWLEAEQKVASRGEGREF